MTDQPNHTKEDLLRELSLAPQASAKVEAVGRKLILSARLASDVAAPLGRRIEQLPDYAIPPQQLDQQVESWRSWNLPGLRLF